jgi:iron complex transport system ATP-binding protein
VALMLALEDVSVGYAGTRGAVVSAIDLNAEHGAFVCILGRNGAGKSTLMRTIAGLQPALRGTVSLDGAAISAMQPITRAQRIAVVLTERAFNPALRVEDVVSLGRQPFTQWHGRLTDEDRRIADEALGQAGAAMFRGRFIDDLSDGERQRVMIARAIAQTARLMVLDEITAFLDLPGRIEVMTLLKRHARENKAIVLLSSHDLDLSLQLADSVWLLDGAGVLEVGSPEDLIGRGAIGRAFDTSAVKFSAEQRRFLFNGLTGP